MQHKQFKLTGWNYKVTYLVFFLALSLILSLCGNAHLFLKLRQSIKAPAPTLEAKEVLASLASGQSILRIQVLDPESLMMRSPRR